MTIRFFGHQDSGHAFKVGLGLRHFGFDYHYTWIDIWADPSTRPQEFLEASRFSEVPLLLIDGQTLTQSAAILMYLADKAGQKVSQGEREFLFWEGNRIGMAIPQLLYEIKANHFVFGEDTKTWLKDRYELDVSRLSAQIGSQPFMFGDEMTIADIAVFGYTQWHKEAGLEAPDNVTAWCERIRALPYYLPADELLGQQASG